ncbi:MAG: hypothetical protein IH604_01440 [Burkholderiales bacterium]|nr:hypothetical protein [Burkholderiales bacterium]
MKGADAIARFLKQEGTEFLACYPRNALIDACAAIDIRSVLCRQERVGVAWPTASRASIAAVIKEGLDTNAINKPFLLEVVAKKGYDFSRYD